MTTANTDTNAQTTWPTFTRDVARVGAAPASETREFAPPASPAMLSLVTGAACVGLLCYAVAHHAWWATAVLVVALAFSALGAAGGMDEAEAAGYAYSIPSGSAAARVIDPSTGRWPRGAVDRVLQARGLQKVEHTVEAPRRSLGYRAARAGGMPLPHDTPREVTRRTGTIATGVTPQRDGDILLHLRLGPGVTHAQVDALAEPLARALRVTRVDGGARTAVSSGETTIRLTMREAAVPETLDDEWE